MINKPYRPWYDDTKDYNTNAPSYYDYLANEINLEKAQTDAINDLLVRDVDFKDSDEVHVDKLTNWHTDDSTPHAKITFKAHVISSPSSTTQTIDGVDYVTSNGVKILHDGVYAPDYKKVLEKYSADTNSKFTKVTNDINTINTKLPYKENKLESSRKTITVTHGAEGTSATTKVDTNPQKVLEHDNLKVGEKLVKTHNTSSNDTTISLDSNFISQVNKATSDVSGKQNKLTAGYGIKIDENNTITSNVPTRVPEAFDLNNFTDGIIKGNNLTNAPDNSWWIVEAFTDHNYAVQNAVKLVTSGNNTKTYTRHKQNSIWTEWDEQLTSKKELTEAIKTVNKSYNLQNPDIYDFHVFSNVGTLVTGDWGFEFFNDTNSKVYNVKIKVGTIKEANPNTIIAQQNVSTLLASGVPQDFITKATNGYVFRAGYYIGDTLNRIAFQLQTVDDKMNLTVKYYDAADTIRNQLIVQGHECVPIAVSYSNAISIEETGEFKPVDDSTNE